MCICTPEIKSPYCKNCFSLSPNSLIDVRQMPPVVEPPLCNLRDFYDAASENLSHAAFLHLVKKAQQDDGV